jgi:opacity protein-like surface antigen
MLSLLLLLLKAILPYKNWEFFGLGGGGVYFVSAELKGNAVIGGTLYAYDRDDKDSVIGVYLGAGIHYNITPAFFVGVEGKYFWTDDVDVRDEVLGVSAGRKFDMDGIIATAVIGFRF